MTHNVKVIAEVIKRFEHLNEVNVDIDQRQATAIPSPTPSGLQTRLPINARP